MARILAISICLVNIDKRLLCINVLTLARRLAIVVTYTDGEQTNDPHATSHPHFTQRRPLASPPALESKPRPLGWPGPDPLPTKRPASQLLATKHENPVRPKLKTNPGRVLTRSPQGCIRQTKQSPRPGCNQSGGM